MFFIQQANDPFRSSHRELISQAVLDSAHSLISIYSKTIRISID